MFQSLLLVVHRGHYPEAFLAAVRDKRIPIYMGHDIVGYDDNKPSIELTSGVEKHADGIKSRARELVHGFRDKPESLGYAFCRASFKETYLKADPLYAEFTQSCPSGAEHVERWQRVQLDPHP